MILAQFLPERSASDILAGRVRLVLGGEEFRLAALPIAENEAWQERFAALAGGLFRDVDKLDSVAAVLARFAAATDVQIALLRAYDKGAVLPDDEWVRAHVTPDALLRAVLEVIATAYPLLAAALDLVVRNPDVIRSLVTEGLARTTAAPPPAPTSGVRPSTAGARATSVAS